MQVNQKVGLTFNITLSDTVNQNDSFKITFPNTLSVFYTNVTTSGSSEGNSSLSGQILNVNQNSFYQVEYF
jgi:hypothetical protein